MIILDSPYVSALLKNAILVNGIETLCSGDEIELNVDDLDLISTEKAVEMIHHNENIKIYTNSENAINWISENLQFTGIPEKIDIFKNKVQFRQLLTDTYPDFFFKEILQENLINIDYTLFERPFILKPAVGFFSMGVFKITSENDWNNALRSIEEDLLTYKNLYPDSVYDATTFIAEDIVEGDEYAIDAYFNEEGEAVVLNILKHLFASEDDVSDRVYITSDEIISENIESFTDFLNDLGDIVHLKNFPCHVELRIDKKGRMIPIEINPMRFGGWCTTADLALMAWDFNPYLYYLNDEKPQWSEILKNKKNKIYSVVVLDNSTSLSGENIMNFDYDKLLSGFQKPLELRKINYKKYPVFGFLFVETEKDKMDELYDILKSSLDEFI